MGKTSIEWTDASWNPIVGCTEISPGCANCYAARLAATRLKHVAEYVDLAEMKNGKPRWKGEVGFCPERLEEPLHWRKPRRIFVCDMGDLFHESVQWSWLGQIFEVMRKAHWHTFQVLTKRAAKMHEYCRELSCPLLPNVWLGVSVENQHFADERIPLLLSTPAAVRWISAEPLLGQVHLGIWAYKNPNENRSLLNWVVCGGESGPNARPMHPDWARLLRDECQTAGVPFFFKQWGEFLPLGQWGTKSVLNCNDSRPHIKVGKKKAGRLLDGREWNDFPSR